MTIFYQILIAIVTALATTLVVEYLAKPKLELRKGRLIRDRNNLDEIVFSFQELGMHFGTLYNPDPLLMSTVPEFLIEEILTARGNIRTIQNKLARQPLGFVQRNAEQMRAASLALGDLLAVLKLMEKAVENRDFRNYFSEDDSVKRALDTLEDASYFFEYHRRGFIVRFVKRAELKERMKKLQTKHQPKHSSEDISREDG